MFPAVCILILSCNFCLGVKENPSVIIIGAGASGIAAASKLIQNSITNVTILEAENRIGGRINTTTLSETFVDLGAEYCHGTEENIVYNLTIEYDLLKSTPSFLTNGIYYSNGTKLDSLLANDLLQLLATYKNLQDSVYNISKSSLGEVFIHRFNITLLKKYENDANKLKILNESLKLLEALLVGPVGAYSWFDVAYRGGVKNTDSKTFLWKSSGYKTLFDILMKNYPDSNNKLAVEDKIHFNTKACKINWQRNDSIDVETCCGRTYFADYVIFTPSVGVLKKQNEKLFNPQLPEAKQKAIEAIGLGCVIKVFIHFPIQWWKNDETTFPFVWRNEDLPKDQDEYFWVPQIRIMSQNANNPNIWVAGISGDLVLQIEKLSAEELKSGFRHLLNKFFGTSYEMDMEIITSSWCSNGNFMGTDSFIRNGYDQEKLSHRTILAEPLFRSAGDPALLFAGEATNPVHPSMVHGAIETGYREADRILKLYRNH